MMRRGIWMGTRDHAMWVPAPSISGYGSSSVGWSSKSVFLNGRASVRRSQGSHKEYQMTWTNKSQGDLLPVHDFAQGMYGDGFIYWSDPFAEKTNVLPKDWATPQLGAEGKDGLNVCGGIRRPTLVSSDPGRYGFPAQAAVMPRFEASEADRVLLRTNLVTTPSFEGASSLTTVRENLATRPTAATAVAFVPSGVGTSATASRVTTGGEIVPSFDRLTFPAGVAPAGGTDMFAAADVNRPLIAAGETVTASVYVRSSIAQQVRAQIQWLTTLTSGNAGQSSGPSVTLVPNTWTRISVTGVAPAGGAYARLDADTGGQTIAWPEGATVDVQALLVEKLGAVLPYFDGSTAAAGDFTYSWAGTANASISRQQGMGAAGAPQTNLRAIQSSEWASSGSKSLRLIPVAVSGGAYVRLSASSVLVGGKTYTASVKARITAVSGVASASNVRSLRFLTGANPAANVHASAPDTIGVHELSITFTVPVGDSVGLYLYGSSALADSPDIWFDDLIITEEATAGHYFDGSSSLNDGHVYAWTGTANASTSTERGFVAPINADAKKATILIPPHRDLIIRAYGSESGGQYRYAVQQKGQSAVLVPWTSTSDPNATGTLRRFPGGSTGSYVDVYLSSDSPTATATIIGAMAQIVPTDSTPTWQQFFSGHGAAGCRFETMPQETPYSAALDMIGMSATLIEVGP